MKVCDRCGKEAYTCIHMTDDDYVLEPIEDYRKGILMVRIVLTLGFIWTCYLLWKWFYVY